MSEYGIFKAGYWLKTGWEIFKHNLKIVLLGAMVFNSITFVLTHLFKQYYFTMIVQLLISPSLVVGWGFYCLRTVLGEKPGIWSLFDGYKMYPRLWSTYMLTTVVICGGILLFIIPGIVLSLKFGMVFFIIMDKS